MTHRYAIMLEIALLRILEKNDSRSLLSAKCNSGTLDLISVFESRDVFGSFILLSQRRGEGFPKVNAKNESFFKENALMLRYFCYKISAF